MADTNTIAAVEWTQLLHLGMNGELKWVNFKKKWWPAILYHNVYRLIVDIEGGTDCQRFKFKCIHHFRNHYQGIKNYSTVPVALVFHGHTYRLCYSKDPASSIQEQDFYSHIQENVLYHNNSDQPLAKKFHEAFSRFLASLDSSSADADSDAPSDLTDDHTDDLTETVWMSFSPEQNMTDDEDMVMLTQDRSGEREDFEWLNHGANVKQERKKISSVVRAIAESDYDSLPDVLPSSPEHNMEDDNDVAMLTQEQSPCSDDHDSDSTSGSNSNNDTPVYEFAAKNSYWGVTLAERYWCSNVICYPL